MATTLEPVDAVLVGFGWTGAIMGQALCEAGLNVLALERGKPGGHYILGGQDVTLRAMLASIADCAGRRAPRIQLPRAPIYPLALAAEITGRLTGRTPFLTLDGLRMSKHHMFFSSAKAARELGYTARPYEAGIRDAISWFRNAGYLH